MRSLHRLDLLIRRQRSLHTTGTRPVRAEARLLLALVELGEPLAGLSYLRVVRVLAQVSVRVGGQGDILGTGVAQPFQQLLTILVSGRSHDFILPEALPEGS